MAGESTNPWASTEMHVHLRLVELAALKRYLTALGHVAEYAAQTHDPRELLAAARMIREDAPRGLRRLGVRV